MRPFVGNIKTAVQTPGDQMNIGLVSCKDIPKGA
jgi:hypothetical protein